MQEYQSLSNETQSEGFNLQDQIDGFLIYWKWILLSVLLTLSLAFVYLRYSVPLYSASASIMVRDERKGGLQSELNAFSDLNLTTIKSNVDNEIEILKSRTTILKVIKKIGFNVSYFSEGRLKSTENYSDSPIKCSFLEPNNSFYENYDSFVVNAISESSFELLNANKTKIGIFNYGEVINLKNSKLIISKNQSEKNFSVVVNVSRILDVAQSYKGRLNVAVLGKNTSILELTISDPIKEKSQDFLNALIEVYNQDAIEDKNYISRKTIDFIENRIKLIATELGEVEKNEEGFKKYNKLTDIKEEANLYLNTSSEFEKSLIQTETEIRITNNLLEYIKTMNSGDLLPNNIVPIDVNATSLISEYNTLVLTRNRLIKEGTKKSIVLENFEQSANDLLDAIQQSLMRLKTNSRIKKSDLEKQLNLIDGKISLIPTQSKQLRIIERQQKIKETLYLYLLEKREETAISLAVTAPNAKTIDTALFSSAPVSPKKDKIYMFAFLVGLIIPIGLIFLFKLLDTKIKTRQDVESLTSIPFLGDVPKSEKNNEIIDSKNRSSTAEAIRIIRTNLEFLLGHVNENKAKVVFVTSTIPKEGKTFVAVNLASTISTTHKKVLLIGLDIRNPQIEKYLDLPNTGLTNYLSKQNQSIDDYIVKIENYDNFYVLPAGTIPPNPVELLMNNKIDILFEELKNKFDYIIVDTAPVSLVTDTLIVSKNADAFIYVVRANYLDKRLLKIAENFYKEKKLPNMSILLNDTVWKKRYGYGYTYGYAYGYSNEKDKKSWFVRLKSKIFKS